MTATTLSRFLDKVTIDKNGCWVWTGALSTDEYGRFKHDGKCVQTHRLAFEHFRGSIPADMEIDHLCGNRSCTNPMHLEAVSKQVNLMRRFYKRQVV